MTDSGADSGRRSRLRGDLLQLTRVGVEVDAGLTTEPDAMIGVGEELVAALRHSDQSGLALRRGDPDFIGLVRCVPAGEDRMAGTVGPKSPEVRTGLAVPGFDSAVGHRDSTQPRRNWEAAVAQLW